MQVFIPIYFPKEEACLSTMEMSLFTKIDLGGGGEGICIEVKDL
jgi:hypothetical protein